MKKALLYSVVVCAVSSNAALAQQKIDLMDGLKSRMHYLSERQSVVAQNIANADTPGYKAQDIAPLQLPAGTRTKIRMQRTSAFHLQGSGGGSRFRVIPQESAYETSPDGNNVVVEEQMLKMSENDIDYRATTGMMRKVRGMMMTALGKNGAGQ